MKKFVVMVCVILSASCAWGGVSLSAFPDPAFREHLRNYDSGWVEYDSNGNAIRDAYGNTIYFGKDNGILDDKEIEGITSLGFGLYNEVTSLEGIKHLTSLKYLYCSYGQLTKIDVSGMKNLTTLHFYGNPLVEFNASNCTALAYVIADGLLPPTVDDGGSWKISIPSLKKIDASNCTAMQSLSCGFLYYGDEKSQLSELNIAGCTSLQYLSCINTSLTAIDVSIFPALVKVTLANNPLKTFDISNHTALTTLKCYDNNLTQLNVNGCTALTELHCFNNQLTALDVSTNTALTELYCYDNQLTVLDVSGLTALTLISCQRNPLKEFNASGCTSLAYVNTNTYDTWRKGQWSLGYYPSISTLEKLNASNCTALTGLSCGYNNLTELNLSGCTALTGLYCDSNDLTELDLSECTALTSLNCDKNNLTEIDVSKNTALTGLYCSENRLTSLDLSKNTTLTNLCCDKNKLTSLDLSKNTKLTYLDCRYNELTELDLSNNTALTEVYCYDQKRSGLNVNKTSRGYEVNMKDYVSDISNIDNDNIYVSYDKEAGIFFSSKPITRLQYRYITHSPNNDLMDVTITNPLSIAPIERAGIGLSTIIRDITDSSYIGLNGHSLTESSVSYYDYSDYVKKGIAADGNSRLIIRVQTDKPGTASFSFNDDIGAKLEALTSRKELSPSDQLNTTQFEESLFVAGMVNKIYQVSVVLVAPERFPKDKNFPYDKFKVHVRFTDEDGETTEDDLELKLEAAPVILIHGMRDEGANCFGVGKNSGIWHTLRQNGFRDIRIWNYGGSRGPEDLLSGVGFANPLFRTLCEVFDKYLNRGIVCTRADFVCHSMGGLMARKFLEETGKELINGNNWSERSYKQGMVRRVITIATPHRGSPWADIMIEGSTNPMLWPVRQILYGLMNISAGKLGYFDKNSDSAFRDLMTTAPRAYGFPSDVPMYSIHGDVKDNVKAFSQYIGNTGTWIGKLARFTPPHIAMIMQVVGSGMELSAGIADIINDDVFKGEEHDMLVSVPSAAGDFAGSEKGYKGWDYMHINICHQNIIGNAVVNLLKGPVDVFKKFGASAKTAANKSSPSPKKMTSNSDSEQMKFIEALNLKIEPSVFTVSDNTSQTVKFSVTASSPTTYDIYCAVEAGNAYKLFKIPASNDGKTFSAQIVFASQDSGVMNAFCFSHNPNDSEGKSLHLSNVAKILALSDITNANIVSLDFAGKETAYTSVNSEIPAGLYAVDSDGRYYDVSSPLAGTQWTSTEFARVNDNGCILGLKEGTATLTATFRGLTASVNVEVSAAIEEDTQEETPPEILTETLSNAITNQSYSLQLKASGTTPITWTHTGKLPAGLSLTEAGLISGTPTKAGKSSFTVTAQNSYGKTSKSFTIQTFDPVTITTASLKAGTIGKSYNVTMRAKGSKTITWSAEGLPNGLTINDRGKISGKPTVYGLFNVKLKAENGAGITEKTLQLTVKAIAPTLSGTLAKPTLNVPYSSGLKLSKGSTPVTWSVEGKLPGGLSLDSSTGIISGTPASYDKSGFKFTITASNDAGRKSKNITLKVKGIAPKITVKLPQATAGENYSAELSATGSEPITFAADLPEYLTLDGSTINGTVPDSVKSFKITAYASNPVKKNVKKSYTIKASAKESLPQNQNADNDTDITEISGGINSRIDGGVPSFTENIVHLYSESYMIVAELGEVSCDMAGLYDFNVEIPDCIPEGSELVYISNSDEPSSDDEIAEFFDEEGNEISKVPESRKISISIWLNPERIYRPVIAVKR